MTAYRSGRHLTKQFGALLLTDIIDKDISEDFTARRTGLLDVFWQVRPLWRVQSRLVALIPPRTGISARRQILS